MSGKGHRKSKVGRKADKRKTADHKKKGTLEESKAAKAGNNPKAFAFQSAGKAKAQRARSSEKEQRRLHGGPTLPPCDQACMHALTHSLTHACAPLRPHAAFN
jgi:hypothetical protein